MDMVSDEHIDALLCFMNDEIERLGHRPATVSFDLTAGTGEDFLRFQQKLGLSSDEAERVVKTSYCRGYLEHPYCTGGKDILRLTTEGHGRAISVARAKHCVPQSQQPTISIGAINGPTQIGNHNTQTVEALFQYIATAIDKTEAPPEQKEEAKGLLRRFLEHPLTCAVIGAGVGAGLGAVLPKQ